MYGQIVSLGIPPSYFLDEMSFEEIAWILKAESNKRRDEWEKVRTMCFYSSQSGAKKPEELFSLPWDKKETKKKSRLTPDKAKATAKQLEARLNGNKQRL